MKPHMYPTFQKCDAPGCQNVATVTTRLGARYCAEHAKPKS